MQKQRLILIISMGLLTSFMTLCAAIEPTEATIDAREFTGKDGEKLLYRVFKPANYDPDKKYPLVLCLHGGGGKGNDNKSRGTQAFIALSDPEVQNDYPAFLVTPQCPQSGSWALRGPDRKQSVTEYPMSRETKLVLEILDSLQKEFSIDPSRLYVSGQSMGGRGTWDIIQRRPTMFAAAVPVCGVGDPSEAKRIAHMPIWNFHGDKDGVVPVKASRDMVTALKKEDSKVIYSELKGVNHGSWIPAWETEDLIPWLFKQRNPTPGKAQSSIKPRQYDRSFERKVEVTAKLEYLLYVHRDYPEAQEKWPLILFLHGGGEKGSDLKKVRRQGLPKLLEKKDDLPFIVASPQCPGNSRWSDHTQILALNALLDELIEKYPVDEDRVYLTGLSMGGMGSWALGPAFPERFAAMIPICGGGNHRDARKLTDMPIWVFHGAKDRVVPISKSQEMVDALKRAGNNNVKFTVYPEAGHDSWTETYNNPEIYKWLLKHKRSK